MVSENFVIKAGKDAFESIQESGFRSDKIKVISGAAGGPKWLLLSQVDRLMVKQWFADRVDPIHLVGSSIGAWRFAALSQSNPHKALETFEERYLAQRYSDNPTPTEVTEEGNIILNTFVTEQGIQEILDNPVIKLNLFAVKCRGLTASENKKLQIAGLAVAAGINLFSRKALERIFERTLFRVPGSQLFQRHPDSFNLKHVELTTQNIKAALMASGSIPTVMNGVTFNDPELEGIYRDGGLLEYHLDLPYNRPEKEDLVFFPHFTDRVIPGWLDKKLTWRKPRSDNMKNVVLIAPSESFISKLPYQKIPDRKDFKFFGANNTERIHYWKTVITLCRAFADDVFNTLESSRIKQVIQPL